LKKKEDGNRTRELDAGTLVFSLLRTDTPGVKRNKKNVDTFRSNTRMVGNRSFSKMLLGKHLASGRDLGYGVRRWHLRKIRLKESEAP
jgi:hypothetical protein